MPALSPALRRPDASAGWADGAALAAWTLEAQVTGLLMAMVTDRALILDFSNDTYTGPRPVMEYDWPLNVLVDGMAPFLDPPGASPGAPPIEVRATARASTRAATARRRAPSARTARPTPQRGAGGPGGGRAAARPGGVRQVRRPPRLRGLARGARRPGCGLAHPLWPPHRVPLAAARALCARDLRALRLSPPARVPAPPCGRGPCSRRRAARGALGRRGLLCRAPDSLAPSESLSCARRGALPWMDRPLRRSTALKFRAAHGCRLYTLRARDDPSDTR